jgi:hypothetical protein
MALLPSFLTVWTALVQRLLHSALADLGAFFRAAAKGGRTEAETLQALPTAGYARPPALLATFDQ